MRNARPRFCGGKNSNRNIYSTPELNVVRGGQYPSGGTLPLQVLCPWFNIWNMVRTVFCFLLQLITKVLCKCGMRVDDHPNASHKRKTTQEVVGAKRKKDVVVCEGASSGDSSSVSECYGSSDSE